MTKTIICVIAGAMLICYYFIMGLPNTFVGNFLMKHGLGGFINFVVANNLIIFCLLVTLFIVGLFSIRRIFWIIAIFLILMILYYFKIIPRLVL
jgi:hypothetical protein